MKLPANMSKIIGKAYTGQKDEEGRPHGHGTMLYSTRFQDMPMEYGFGHAECSQGVLPEPSEKWFFSYMFLNDYYSHSIYFDK